MHHAALCSHHFYTSNVRERIVPTSTPLPIYYPMIQIFISQCLTWPPGKWPPSLRWEELKPGWAVAPVFSGCSGRFTCFSGIFRSQGKLNLQECLQIFGLIFSHFSLRCGGLRWQHLKSQGKSSRHRRALRGPKLCVKRDCSTKPTFGAGFCGGTMRSSGFLKAGVSSHLNKNPISSRTLRQGWAIITAQSVKQVWQKMSAIWSGFEGPLSILRVCSVLCFQNATGVQPMCRKCCWMNQTANNGQWSLSHMITNY